MRTTSTAEYFLSEILERGELQDIIDGMTGITLGVILANLVAEGWKVIPPPEVKET